MKGNDIEERDFENPKSDPYRIDYYRRNLFFHAADGGDRCHRGKHGNLFPHRRGDEIHPDPNYPADPGLSMIVEGSTPYHDGIKHKEAAMPDTAHNTVNETSAHIHITGLNKDKTRAMGTSDSLYQVYFELSGNPSQVWKNIFEKEWKDITKTLASEKRAKASIDRGFLVIHCQLKEVGTIYLPALKSAFTITNTNFQEYEQHQSLEHSKKENVWKIERKIVEDLEKTLIF